MRRIEQLLTRVLHDEDCARPEFAAEVARQALALTPEEVDALVAIEAPFSLELAAVTAAARSIGDGKDDEGLEALRTIGLKSPFRQARLFLRGLSAFYRGQDDEAVRALRSVSRDQVQWPAAEALLLVLEPESADCDGIMRAAPVLQALGLHRAADGLLVSLVRRHFDQGKINAALRVASKVLPAASEGLADSLRRDLPAALLVAGVERHSVFERVDRAFPADPQDHRLHRLRAWLAEASGDLDRAIGNWLVVASAAADGSFPLPEEDRALVAAAISQHIGELFARCARADDDHSRSSPFVFGRRSSRHSALWSRAFEAFSEAVETDPLNVEAWQGQIESASYLADKRERVRVLERFIKQFPESAEAVIAAARASGERGAFDKGLRFARRAAELEPLNRSIRDIEAWLLCGKGRKKYRAGDKDTGRRCYDEARALVTKCTRAQRLRVLAAVAAYLLVTDGGEVAAVEQRVADDGQSQWLWRGYLCIEGELLLARRLRPGRGFPPARRRIPMPPKPAEAPSGDEVSALLSLVHDAEERRGHRTPEFFELLVASLDAGGTRLSDREDLDLAISIAPRPSLKLQLAERGQELWPGDPQFTSIRYSTALILKLPGNYFDRAQVELETARRSLRETFDAHRADYTPGTKRTLLRRIVAIERYIDTLIADVSRYRTRENTTQRVLRRNTMSNDDRQLTLFKKG